jgi:hypothetical protein
VGSVLDEGELEGGGGIEDDGGNEDMGVDARRREMRRLLLNKWLGFHQAEIIRMIRRQK